MVVGRSGIKRQFLGSTLIAIGEIGKLSLDNWKLRD